MGQARRSTRALRQLHALVRRPGPAGAGGGLPSTHVVRLDDAAEARLAFRHVLSMNHATECELLEFSAKLMVAELELDVCGVPGNGLAPNVHDDLAPQDSAAASRDPMKAPAWRGLHGELPRGERQDVSIALGEPAPDP